MPSTRTGPARPASRRRPRCAAAARTAITAAIAFAALAGTGTATAGPTPPPAYEIIDVGVVNPADIGIQGQGISPGGVAVGRTLGTSNQGWSFTVDGGLVPLPKLPTRVFAGAADANDRGFVVGTAADTFFGTNPLPVVWKDGVIEVLPLPATENIGRAFAVNAAALAAGSVDGGSFEQAALFDAGPGGTGTKITAAAANGSTMTTAFGINDAGLVCGVGRDPNNAARNAGLVFDIDAGTMTDIGALPGRNGAIPFAISSGGHVVGSSMQNQGSGVPFIWTASGGMQQVPLPAGTNQGSARGVNAAGMIVGIASATFSVPFLSDGQTTWSLAELIPAGTGWDLDMNTSSGALGISDDGTIVGTGELNGETRAFVMVPKTAPCEGDLDLDGVVGFTDLLLVLNSYGPCTACPQDLDGSGTVDFGDVTFVLSRWGVCG